MPVSAQKIDAWYLVNLDCRAEYREITENGVSRMQKFEIYVLQRQRKLIMVTRFLEEVGDRLSSFMLGTGGGAVINYSSPISTVASRKLICTSDNLAISDTVPGEAIQTQTWEYHAEPEDVEYTEFVP